MFYPLLVGLTLLSAVVCSQKDPVALHLLEIQAVADGHTEASPKAKAAWEKIVATGPAALPRVLEAMDHPDPVVGNWLRAAFDRIVDEEMRHQGKGIDPQPLLSFATNPRRHGPARRLALELVDRLRPHTSRLLLPGWLDDPEFRYDAVDLLTSEAEVLAGAGAKDKAVSALRRAFQATDDVSQAQQLSRHLKRLGVSVDLAGHFGFLTDWYVIGPFDGKQQHGFRTLYPPEQKVDLKAQLGPAFGKFGGWRQAPVVRQLANKRKSYGQASARLEEARIDTSTILSSVVYFPVSPRTESSGCGLARMARAQRHRGLEGRPSPGTLVHDGECSLADCRLRKRGQYAHRRG